jgi:peptidoglycan/xylan/chitin deacetylase (PgdA/CDA1 family)
MRASPSRRAVALTFSDGPGGSTEAVLEILEQHGVPGTFFVIGCLVRGNEALLRRALAQGSALGNHTFTHVKAASRRELHDTQYAIRQATGYTPRVFRPPHGALSRRLVVRARLLGLHTIGGGVDSRDWSEPGSQAIYERVVSGARPGAIVLLHDGGPWRGQMLAALPRIIATLRSRGYGFLTVPALLGARNGSGGNGERPGGEPIPDEPSLARATGAVARG